MEGAEKCEGERSPHHAVSPRNLAGEDQEGDDHKRRRCHVCEEHPAYLEEL